MKKMLLLLLLLSSVSALAQQSKQFNHYLFNGLYINPAYAGYRETPNFHSFFKSGGSITGAPQTFALSVDGAIADGKSGVGLLLNYEQIGAQRISSAYFNYAYRMELGYSGQSRLAFGFGLGMTQGALNVSRNVLVGEEFELQQEMETTLVPDIRMGVFYANQNFFVGFSAENLMGVYLREDRTDNLVIPVPELRYYISAGGLIPVFPGIDLKPSVLFKDQISEPALLHLNALAVIGHRVQVGGFYRTSAQFYDKPIIEGALKASNAFGVVAEVVAFDRLRIGYAYDHALNNTSNFNSGSHEVFLGIRISNGKHHANKRLLAEFPF